MKFLSSPFDVVLGVTNKCNFSCKHCLAGTSLKSDDDLTRQELFSLIDQLVEAKVFRICIFGGEPFIRADIFDILDYVHEKPVGISLNTNATLITPAKAMRLAGYRKLTGIIVSFDADRPDEMDEMRGPGAYQTALAGIENLLQHEKFVVTLSCTVTKLNYSRILETAALARKLGVQVRFNSVFFGGNAQCNIRDLMLTPEEQRRALSLVREAVHTYGNMISGSYVQSLGIIESLDRAVVADAESICVSPCGAATKKCCISADGWVTPCELIWDVKAGNIKEETFTHIWNDSLVMNQFRKSFDFSLKDRPRCIPCRYKRYCYQGHRCMPYCFTENPDLMYATCIEPQ